MVTSLDTNYGGIDRSDLLVDLKFNLLSCSIFIVYVICLFFIFYFSALYMDPLQIVTKFGQLKEMSGCRIKSLSHLTVCVPRSIIAQEVIVQVLYEGITMINYTN